MYYDHDTQNKQVITSSECSARSELVCHAVQCVCQRLCKLAGLARASDMSWPCIQQYNQCHGLAVDDVRQAHTLHVVNLVSRTCIPNDATASPCMMCAKRIHRMSGSRQHSCVSAQTWPHDCKTTHCASCVIGVGQHTVRHAS